jgi:hypothetical protein
VHGGLDDPLEDLARQLLDGPVGHHLGGVDHRVEPPEPVDGRLHGRVERVLVQHVGRADDRGGSPGRMRLLGSVRQRLVTAGDQD